MTVHNSLSVGEIVKRTLLVDDAHGSLLGPDTDASYVIGGLSQALQLAVDDVRCFDRCLSVELSRV